MPTLREGMAPNRSESRAGSYRPFVTRVDVRPVGTGPTGFGFSAVSFWDAKSETGCCARWNMLLYRRDVARQSQLTAPRTGPIERFGCNHGCEELANGVIALRTTEGFRLAVTPTLLITAERDGYVRFASDSAPDATTLAAAGCSRQRLAQGRCGPGLRCPVTRRRILNAL